MIVQTFFAQS